MTALMEIFYANSKTNVASLLVSWYFSLIFYGRIYVLVRICFLHYARAQTLSDQVAASVSLNSYCWMSLCRQCFWFWICLFRALLWIFRMQPQLNTFLVNPHKGRCSFNVRFQLVMIIFRCLLFLSSTYVYVFLWWLMRSIWRKN